MFQKAIEWLMQYPHRCREVLTCIQNCIEGRSDTKERLTYLYLISEILQRTNRRATDLDEWTKAILNHLPMILQSVYQQNEAAKNKILRVLSNWEGRKFFPRQVIERLKEIMEVGPISVQ